MIRPDPISAAAASAAVSSLPQATAFTTDLKHGSTGPQVARLQQLLHALGYLSSSPTGMFGLQTEAALKKYQKAHHLEQTGAVGPKTRAQLNADIVAAPSSSVRSVAPSNIFTKNLSLGSKNAEVLALQKYLAFVHLLPADAITGYFGAKTRAAIKAFQSAHHIEPLGNAGPATRALLNSLLGLQAAGVSRARPTPLPANDNTPAAANDNAASTTAATSSAL